jgi:uncharacterized membrane protein
VDLATLLHSFALPSLHGLRLTERRALYLFIPVALLLLYGLWNAGSLRRWLAPLLRTSALSLIVLALANPQTISRSEGVTRPIVLDASASITPAMRAWAVGLLRDQLRLRAGDPALVFGDAVVHTTVGNAVRTIESPDGCRACDPRTTDLQSVLNAIAGDPSAHDGPIAIVTDGWETRGDAASALEALRAAGIELYLFTPPGARAIPNIAMTQLTLPSALEKAGAFSLGVTVNNLNAQSAAGSIFLYRNGGLIEQQQVTLPPGQSRFDFPMHAEESGLASYRAVFKPANPALDAYPEDNSIEGWVGIGAQRKVLILTDSARDAAYLETAVRRLGLQPTIATPPGAGAINPKGYDAVILNNFSHARLGTTTENELVRYVADGGALAMVGGDQSFGLGGYAGSAIAKMMPVVMKPPEHHERKRALILILDKSGSMGRNDKLNYAKAAALTVTKSLKDTDLVGVIGFDSQPFVVVPLEPVAQVRPYFAQLVDRLSAHGTTFMLPALQEADRTLAQSGASLKHVVVLTDGETGGTAAMYYDLVSTMHHERGATISTIAIGREANLPLLEAIAKYGGGGFYQTDSPETLPELFLEDVNRRGGGDTTMVEKEFMPYTVTPDPVLKDLAGRRLGPLKGFVATDLKPGAALSMFVESNGTREPILASWKYGAGKTLAMTTDASGRWSASWVGNGSFASVWDRVLNWMTPPQTLNTDKYDVALGYNAGRITIRLTDYSENAGTTSRPLSAIVTSPDRTRFETILTPSAQGEVTGSFEAPRPGPYLIDLKSTTKGALNLPPLAYTVSPAVNAELPRPAPNYGLLEHLALATTGRLNPSPRELAVSRPMFEHMKSLNPWLIVPAMLLLIAEALIRRITY